MADPVTIGLGSMIVGGGISAISGLSSDNAQADAEAANAAYYKQQAKYSQAATDRELDIFNNEVDDLLGRQLSGYGKAGVSMSGSPLLLQLQTEERSNDELEAIKEKGRQNVELALMRATSAENQAEEIRSAAPWKAFGGLLGTAGSVISAGSKAGKSATMTSPGTVNNYYGGMSATAGK